MPHSVLKHTKGVVNDSYASLGIETYVKKGLVYDNSIT